VTSITGRSRRLPRALTERAAQHASELGRDVMGDPFLLLALLELDPAQPGRRALEAEGVTRDRVLEWIRVRGDRADDPPWGVTYSPAAYIMLGRAQAFAAALGDGSIAPEHVLLALLWDPVSGSSQALWKLGASRERVLDRLREDDVALPHASLPAQREIDWGERVWFDRENVSTVLERVRLQVSPETTWGFNYEDERAWVIAESCIDLQALVDSALAQ
jgi:hypothetical protein